MGVSNITRGYHTGPEAMGAFQFAGAPPYGFLRDFRATIDFVYNHQDG